MENRGSIFTAGPEFQPNRTQDRQRLPDVRMACSSAALLVKDDFGGLAAWEWRRNL
jgi:hypothetical protein